ncbi:MAG: alpha/beta hydrolase [Hyphomonadaceae bacterium]
MIPETIRKTVVFSAFAACVAAAPGAALAQQTDRAQAATRNCGAVEAQPDTLPGAISYTYKSAGRPLRIHLFDPAPVTGENRPAVLFFFGGGWRTGKITAFEAQARALSARGYVTALADYRVSCRENVNALDSVADARSAYDWLRGQAHTLQIDPERIVLAGGSAGGHLAATTAMLADADDKPAALVLFNPAVDMELIGPRIGLTPEASSSISPMTLPLDGLPPTIVFHGKDDTTVPIGSVRAFCARVTGAGLSCDLTEYAGQKHSFFHSRTVDPAIKASPYDDTLKRMTDFLERIVPAKPGGALAKAPK